ncbi:TBC1 domain family member 13 [Ricinus communis]|uniref:TBC1 domain family member 13 n=1 Tax=Ricinus communis TaxID=3988 RepID=UPI00201A4037|nr:TBC1 domain family member 13 [Ricinus communis]
MSLFLSFVSSQFHFLETTNAALPIITNLTRPIHFKYLTHLLLTMLKGKLKLTEKARRVFPDSLGSLVSGLQDDEDEGYRGLDSVFECGEELEIMEPNGTELSKEKSDYEFQYEYDDDDVSVCDDEKRIEKDVPGQGHVSVMEVIAADEKRSDLEHELSQKEINIEKLKRLASTGLPDGGGLRATTWKLLLGYLPPSRDLWEKELTEHRQKYAKLKQELLLSPSELTKINNGAMNSDELNAEGDVAGPLQRHEISHEDHPLSVGKASAWHQYFQHTEIADQIDRDLQRTHPNMKFFSGDSSFSKKNRDAMRNILLLFAKLNPAIRYVQGMNEVLAPIFYVFSTDPDEQNAANAEADSFSCFVRLLSDSVDHFCQQLDNSPVGILSTLSRLADLLKANDEELWRHLQFTTKVEPQFYGFRWITLLLTQEFDLQSILRIWDCLLSNPSGIQDMLLRICCAMLLCVKSRLLSGDFAANLRLLQHYPGINIKHLLQVARDLSPDASSYPSSP